MRTLLPHGSWANSKALLEEEEGERESETGRESEMKNSVSFLRYITSSLAMAVPWVDRTVPNHCLNDAETFFDSTEVKKLIILIFFNPLLNIFAYFWEKVQRKLKLQTTTSQKQH